jgi:hypothetical protein
MARMVLLLCNRLRFWIGRVGVGGDAMKKKIMFLPREEATALVNGRWEHQTNTWEVELMATSGVWAMVRRKGCYPFVVGLKSLKEEKP